MLEQKIKELLAVIDQPKKDISPRRVLAQLAELDALVDEAQGIDPAVFAAFPLELRRAGLQLILRVFASTLQ